MTLDDLRAYWDSRLTDGEKAAIDATIDRARKGAESQAGVAGGGGAWPTPSPTISTATASWISTTWWSPPWKNPWAAARPEDFAPEAWARTGLLFQGNEVSTRAVLDQEAAHHRLRPRGQGHVPAPGPGQDRRAGGAVGRAGGRRAPCLEFAGPGDARFAARRRGQDDHDEARASTGSACLPCCWPPRPTPRASQLREDRASRTPTPWRRSSAARTCRNGPGAASSGSMRPSLLAHRRPGADLRPGERAECPRRAPGRSQASTRPCSGTATCSRSWPTMPGCRSPRSTKIQRQKGDVCRGRRGDPRRAVREGRRYSHKLGWIVEGEGHDKLVERLRARSMPRQGQRPAASRSPS